MTTQPPVHNNNPGNVKHTPGDPWNGARVRRHASITWQPIVDDGNHAQFDNGHGDAIIQLSGKAMGFRALFTTIRSKYMDGDLSLIDIMSEWAPEDDYVGGNPRRGHNDPEAYAEYIRSKWLPEVEDIEDDLTLFDFSGDVFDEETLLNFARAITRYEKGPGWKYSTSDLFFGYAMFLQDKTNDDA